MNPDDPRLTAYSLGELDSAGRADVERLLHEEPRLAADIEETRQFSEILRVRLKSERAEPLLAAQRAEVLAGADRAMPQEASAFSRRIPAWLTLAAGVAAGIGIALLFPALNSLRVHPVDGGGRQSAPRDGSEVRVSLIADPAPSDEGDLVVLNEWPAGGKMPLLPNAPGIVWSSARTVLHGEDAVFHFDTRLPSIEFSAPPVAQNAAPVLPASRRAISRPASEARTLREARYSAAPAPSPVSGWSTSGEERGLIPESQPASRREDFR